jgi:hypothetical protein
VVGSKTMEGKEESLLNPHSVSKPALASYHRLPRESLLGANRPGARCAGQVHEFKRTSCTTAKRDISSDAPILYVKCRGWPRFNHLIQWAHHDTRVPRANMRDIFLACDYGEIL